MTAVAIRCSMFPGTCRRQCSAATLVRLIKYRIGNLAIKLCPRMCQLLHCGFYNDTLISSPVIAKTTTHAQLVQRHDCIDMSDAQHPEAALTVLRSPPSCCMAWSPPTRRKYSADPFVSESALPKSPAQSSHSHVSSTPSTISPAPPRTPASNTVPL